MPDRREFLGAVAGVAAGAMVSAACDCHVMPEPEAVNFQSFEEYCETPERVERLMLEVARETQPDWSHVIIARSAPQHLLRVCHLITGDGRGWWAVDGLEFDFGCFKGLDDEACRAIMRIRRDEMHREMAEQNA